MEIELIAIRLARPLTQEEVARLTALLPPERRQRLEALRDPTRSYEPLCAYAALLMGLHALYGWRALPVLRYSKYGKPYFADYPDVHFSLSHTRGAVLVGIHDQPLGADIEHIRPVSERTMQRLAGTVSEREFFESWTRRESRAKRSGTGLAAMRAEDAPTMYGERFEPLETFAGYAACLCTHADDPIAPLRRFTLGNAQE